MTHAKLLLASKKLDVRELQALRETPSCPPGRDTDGVYSYLPHRGATRRLLHHAAHFAFTRWTNLWFPSRFGIFGDWFAGPVAHISGPGVKDIAVSNGIWGIVPIAAHTSYFKGEASREGNRVTCVAALREALDLELVEARLLRASRRGEVIGSIATPAMLPIKTVRAPPRPARRTRTC